MIFKQLSILLTFQIWSLSAFGEEVLERKIDVRFDQTLLKEALVEVAKKANFEWSYNAGIIENERRVSLIANDWTVREVLHNLLGEGFQFKSSGNYLIIKKAKRPPAQLSGYVKDPKTGERIVGATVYDRKTLRATTTDSNGFYSLKVKKTSEIVVAKLDFRDTVLRVTSQSPRFVSINLKEISPDTTRPEKPKLEEELKAELEDFAFQLNKIFRATLEKWQERNLRDSFHREFQVSFVPKIGTNHTLSGQTTNDYSLNILAGFSKGVEKLEVGGIGNFTRKSVRGIQVGGVFNQNKGTATGLQIAGVYNLSNRLRSGFQAGGVLNLAKTSEEGFQIGGVGNLVVRGETHLQVGGVFNVADQIEGLQIGGISSFAENLTGVQMSGVFNRAKHVQGLQIGLVNAADSCDCLQIGLFNKVGKRWRPFLNW